MDKLISIIVPCYNEQEVLTVFYNELTETLNAMDCAYELILINDGSDDGTLDIMRRLADQDNNIIFISFARNFGKEAAMYAGFCNASGDYVAVMDADMQDPPSLLPQMMQILTVNNYDSVAARRADRKGEPLVRSWFAKKFYQIINKISDAEIVDGARDFRLMKKEMADAIISMGEYNRFSKGIFGWIGFNTYWLAYDNVERVAGKTKWNFWKLFKYALDGIINFSHIPLDIASWSGIGMTLASVVILVLIIIRRLIFGDPVAGWASTICIIIFIGGVQLFCLGVMGQYIAKTYMETKHRPHYIISETNKDGIKKFK